MTLTLDQRLPLVWRTPDSLQLGVDNPPVVLMNVVTGHEKMLAALAIGLTPEGLALIGSESGLSHVQIADFERAIHPALLQPERVRDASVEIDGVGLTADRLEFRLREAGLKPHLRRLHADRKSAQSPSPWLSSATDPADSAGTPDFAVIVGDYVLDPERRGRWLRRDIPHLPIVFGDTSVRIGPFIEPGAGPCLYCLELHRTDADPAWPALASQLLGKASSAQSPFVASEAATIATRMVLNRSQGEPARSATAVIIDAETGEHRGQSWLAHPDCACAGITAGSAQYPRETVRERSSLAAGHATPTTRDEVFCVPE